jgi:hypothetical protein
MEEKNHGLLVLRLKFEVVFGIGFLINFMQLKTLKDDFLNVRQNWTKNCDETCETGCFVSLKK